ncbi:hypothetical protein GCM10020358_67740 [Amorphoplanes nipponensis]|uniref:Uncharacterized protein n=1 Tax=Actinoplanes nipponensis TaxID=135950 RepID=A0A919MRH1_9ACTN|nr:hypothetical protein [Actinoplanes nipponensis]GIE51603.1 hypothetical protein Ani05nite_51370 [Actinoplanes nipponensis]
MNIALLFDASDPTLGSDYGDEVMRRILRTGVLQRRKAHVRVSIGDILTRMLTPDWPVSKIIARIYCPTRFDRLRRDLLERTVTDSTVFCWLLQNLTEDVAEEVNAALAGTAGYLGAMNVSFGDPVQLAMFRQSLPEYIRFRGIAAAVLYTGDNLDPDRALDELLATEGMTVTYEDIGARKTAFDRFTDPAHFRRIEYFQDTAAALDGTSEALLSELALVIEEIHPELFNALNSAMRAIVGAETGEDLAHAALSGRRFLEALANYWYPPRDQPVDGRKVGPAQYRNRLWAYLTEAAATAEPPTAGEVRGLGLTLDDLFDRFNAGVHSTLSRSRVEQTFAALLAWLAAAIRLNPSAAARPYLAYEPELMDYYRKLAQSVLRRAAQQASPSSRANEQPHDS